jgi:methionyl-tRNA synthetase
MPDTPQKKFYLTTPIYYVNARPHIGHAYTTIVGDVVARRHRLLGDDTYLLTGTDEHGQKIERSAAAAGIPPQQFADQVAASFAGLWKRMGITHNQFIRTTDPRHIRGVQKLFSDLYARGFIELRTYTGQYCVSEEMFVEGPPGTIGPDGKPTETVSEENFFFKLSEFQRPLIDLIESNTLVIQPETRRNEVLSFLRGNISATEPGAPSSTGSFIAGQGGVSGEARPPSPALATSTLGSPYVPGALKDLSISRSSFTWGVPVPEPAASSAKEKHVIYVWLDALANYMTAIGYGSDDPADIARFERYWPTDLHLVGKEIIRFHCVYWPAFLMALRPPEIPEAEWNAKWLPKSVVAHGWLLFEESKMSKSRGNIVRTETILDAFGPLCPPTPAPPLDAVILSAAKDPCISPVEPLSPAQPTKAQQDLFAADILRYFLLREIPFGQDGSFSFDALIQRYNSDLANGYANLASRTLPLINKYFEEGVPEATDEVLDGLPPAGVDAAIRPTYPGVVHQCKLIASQVPEHFEQFRFAQGLEEIWAAIAATDSFISNMRPWNLEPWKNANLSDHQMNGIRGDILYVAAESIRIITALLYPILPCATASVWAQLGLGSIEQSAKNGDLKNLTWGGLKPGTKLGPLAPIFPRADKGLAQIMTDMESPQPAIPASPESVSPATAPTPEKSVESVSSVLSFSPEAATPTITIDDFVKIDLRVAQIVVAERIPKADKLLRLEVDLGPNFTPSRRQILSGIAEWYTPEELIGRRIAVIANLAPRKMRGLESHGMLLAASADDHASKPILATFSEEIPLGSRIR